MSRLARDGTAEPFSRDQSLRLEREQGKFYFPCSADLEQDWQPYQVDPYSCCMCDHTYIHEGNLRDILQGSVPTNVKTVDQTFLLHIESNLDRLGSLSPIHGKRSQEKSEQNTLQSVLINKSKFLRATRHAEI